MRPAWGRRRCGITGQRVSNDIDLWERKLTPRSLHCPSLSRFAAWNVIRGCCNPSQRHTNSFFPWHIFACVGNHPYLTQKAASMRVSPDWMYLFLRVARTMDSPVPAWWRVLCVLVASELTMVKTPLGLAFFYCSAWLNRVNGRAYGGVLTMAPGAKVKNINRDVNIEQMSTYLSQYWACTCGRGQ